MKNLVEIMLMIPFGFLGACIGQEFGPIMRLVGSFVGAAVASLLISLL